MRNGPDRLRMDEGWRFHKGDVPAPLANKHLAAYMANKAGWARGAARGNFDDSDWPVVDLPHDWSLDGPFSADHHVNSGFLPRGIGWYRRAFSLVEADRGKVITLRFDAIASHATVYVNGHLLARSFNGYLPVTCDLTDVATFGDELNVVAVRVDAVPMEGWWYEGAGLYRHAWLTKRSPVHVADDGLFAKPVHTSGDAWDTHVRIELNNAGPATTAQVIISLTGPDGVEAGSRTVTVGLPERGTGTADLVLPTPAPRLWDLAERSLYHCHAKVSVAGVLADETSVRYGYRTVRFDADKGFFLNDRHVLLKGTCNHQDHAGVGVAVPDSIHRFRVQRLLDMGTNAFRVGHHPPAPELLDAADELGMLVMDENRSFGSSPERLSQLGDMVRRDRNRPSVVLWSICNEESIQGTPAAREIAAAMVHEVKRLDDSRPVTAAISGGILNDNAMSQTIDVMSINYSFATLDPFHAKWPAKPVVSSETHCALSTRGEYRTHGHVFSGYDDDHAPWGSTAREAWRQIRTRPWMAGLFVWTGFDYRGEPSPHEWPSTVSHWGLIDLCGFAKDTFWRHKAYFSSEPVLHLLPHWNWAPGDRVRVQTLTNADEAELWLNGRSLGRRAVDPVDMAEWTVDFEAGELRAVAYRAGQPVAEATRTTAGAAVALGAEIDPSCDAPLVADGESAWPVTLFALDAAGHRLPTAGLPLHVAAEGPLTLLGVGNGDPNGLIHNRGPDVPLFNGLAQAIVRAGTTAGPARVRVRSPGLPDAVLELSLAPGHVRPAVPPATRRHLLADWLMGPIETTPPDVAASAAGTDMNTWERVKAGGPQAQWSARTGYALYRATLKPPKAMATRGGRLTFARIGGAAEVFIDGASAGPAGVHALAPRTTPADVVVRLHGQDASAGLNGPVELLLD